MWFRGVRSSWLIVARNLVFALFETSAVSLARVNASIGQSVSVRESVTHAVFNFKQAIFRTRFQILSMDDAGLVQVEIPGPGNKHISVVQHQAQVLDQVFFPEVDSANENSAGKNFRILIGEKTGNPATAGKTTDINPLFINLKLLPATSARGVPGAPLAATATGHNSGGMPRARALGAAAARNRFPDSVLVRKGRASTLTQRADSRLDSSAGSAFSAMRSATGTFSDSVAAIIGGCDSTIIRCKCRFSTNGCLADCEVAPLSMQPHNGPIAVTTMKSSDLMLNLPVISFSLIFICFCRESRAFLV